MAHMASIPSDVEAIQLPGVPSDPEFRAAFEPGRRLEAVPWGPRQDAWESFAAGGCSTDGQPPLTRAALASRWKVKPEDLAPPVVATAGGQSRDPRCATVDRLAKAARQDPNDAMRGSFWALAHLHDRCLVRPKPSWFYLAVGTLAGTIGGVAIVAQIVTIVRKRSACDLSVVYLGLTMFTSLLWLLYGFGLNLVVQKLTGAAGIVLVGIILGLKWHYDTDPKCWSS